MAFVSATINPEGLNELVAWIKEKLSDEEQERLANILDKTMEFKGIGGAIIEQFDGMAFRGMLKEGVEALFPKEE